MGGRRYRSAHTALLSCGTLSILPPWDPSDRIHDLFGQEALTEFASRKELTDVCWRSINVRPFEGASVAAMTTGTQYREMVCKMGLR